ncbi:terminase gpA endonuclease subunit [Sulfurivirga sp.]|uniref:terminase gpA endonuclease subunit n=1 Tax=Sulfurivirga sp. TaxID=2614236 RepID=UPI0025D5393F|nr:terminase gpA endonuclease subunit [Sulfurivirga sp.]
MTTLAQQQLEKAKLEALKAQQAFEKALQASIRREQAEATRAVVAQIVRDRAMLLAALWRESLEERDETRIHHQLTDRLAEWLRDVAEAARTATDDPAAGVFASAARPRKRMSVSQWADAYRVMKTGTNQPGPWRTERTPYLREIMDSLSEHSPVRRVIVMKAAGVGVSEAMFNWIGYVIHHLRDRDMMAVMPTLEIRDRTFNPKLNRMLRETPALAGLFAGRRRDDTNRQDLMEFGHGARLIKAGANSPNSLRAEHLPYVVCDELDAFEWDIGGEGDPIELIENRQRTYTRAKSLYISTPTIEETSHIWRLWNESDQRRYHVPCPHCGHRHPLVWKHFKYAIRPGSEAAGRREVMRAWMVCPECGAEIDEHHKPQMLAEGVWIAGHPERKANRGYHINALYAPIGLGPRWIDLAQKWVDAQSDTNRLKVFTNTNLGEPWIEEGMDADLPALMARIEPVELEELPGEILLTAGVDVQKDRLEATLVAWSRDEESWVLEHAIFAGDTMTEEPYRELDGWLQEHEVDVTAIDAHFNADAVHRWCQHRRHVIPVVGVANHMDRPIVEDETRRRQRLRRRRKKGAVVAEPIGVDQAKSLLFSRFNIERPGPGYIHFNAHATLDEVWFDQLTAERLVKEIKGGRVRWRWKPIRPRNEALDCMVYALAAMRLSGIMGLGRWRRRSGRPEATQDAPPAPKPTRPVRLRFRT